MHENPLLIPRPKESLIVTTGISKRDVFIPVLSRAMACRPEVSIAVDFRAVGLHGCGLHDEFLKESCFAPQLYHTLDPQAQ
jgi:hypothetical protein